MDANEKCELCGTDMKVGSWRQWGDFSNGNVVEGIFCPTSGCLQNAPEIANENRFSFYRKSTYGPRVAEIYSPKMSLWDRIKLAAEILWTGECQE